MNKINIYVGLNVQSLKFECGGGPMGFKDGVVRHSVDATSRHLIESGLHPKKIAEKVSKEIEYCRDAWDLHISTHSEVPINLVGHMIHEGKVNAEDVNIFVLSEDNSTIEFHSTYHPEGYLVNWPYGFMEF